MPSEGTKSRFVADRGLFAAKLASIALNTLDFKLGGAGAALGIGTTDVLVSDPIEVPNNSSVILLAAANLHGNDAAPATVQLLLTTSANVLLASSQWHTEISDRICPVVFGKTAPLVAGTYTFKIRALVADAAISVSPLGATMITLIQPGS